MVKLLLHDIANGTIIDQDIAADAVTSTQIRNGATGIQT